MENILTARTLPNKTLNKIFKILFSKEVFVDVKFLERTHNGFQVKQSASNLKAVIQDDTLVIKNLQGNVIFRMVVLKISDKRIPLPISKNFLDRIKFERPVFHDADISFTSKRLLKLFDKTMSTFCENDSFFNARKVFMFLTNHTSSGMFLSSEFGFDGKRILITNIHDQDFASKISDPIFRAKQLEQLKSRKHKIAKQIAELQETLEKINKKIDKLEKF